jgi:hypothetical protein
MGINNLYQVDLNLGLRCAFLSDLLQCTPYFLEEADLIPRMDGILQPVYQRLNQLENSSLNHASRPNFDQSVIVVHQVILKPSVLLISRRLIQLVKPLLAIENV